MISNRRKFLKSAGSTALFTSLGSTFFISCDDTEEVIDPDNNNTVTILSVSSSILTFILSVSEIISEKYQKEYKENV